MKEKSKAKQIRTLERQYFRFKGNPEKQSRILSKITTLKNTKP